MAVDGEKTRGLVRRLARFRGCLGSRASTPEEAPPLADAPLPLPERDADVPDDASCAAEAEASPGRTSRSSTAPQRWTVTRLPTSSESARAPTMAAAVLQMSCDLLCIRTMHVSFTDRWGQRRQCSHTGYNVRIFLPQSASDIEVTFSVVGSGTSVYKVDRAQPTLPWVRDESGNLVPERFTYASPPELVQFFVKGPVLHSFVADADERQRSESLLELVSRDFTCVRSMQVAYTDRQGARQLFTGSGYFVKCHLPSDARDVEVSFSVVGGCAVCKVDRRDPKLPWVQYANGERPHEVFFYPECPQCVQYEIRGVAWKAYISGVYEQHLRSSRCESIQPTGSCGGLRPPEDRRELFEVAPALVPAVGGIVDLRCEHSEYLLPPEVLLFEPSPQEIFHRGAAGGRGARQIFLNTPLSEAESAAIDDLRQALAKQRIIAQATDPLPRYMEAHALRMLQTCKFDVGKTMRMMQTCVAERVRRLPIAEEDVIDDLRSGFMYWHGRDRKCRPCLVIRLERLGELARDRERAVRVVLFTLEYALRFAMVPGRVENWVVVIDLHNVMSVVSPLHIGSMISTASAIGVALEKVYCGRMVWINIINMPGSSMLTRAINSVIPAEKKDKVCFPLDAAAALAQHFEPNQLERRYGGTAPDLAPGETYPFHFFPNPLGDVARSATHSESDLAAAGDCGTDASTSDGGRTDVDGCSFHESVGLDFHQGQLWDESSAEARARWLEVVGSVSLTPEAAEAAAARAGAEVQPCRTISAWLQLVNPQVVDTECTKRVPSRGDLGDLDDEDGELGVGVEMSTGEEPQARGLPAFSPCRWAAGTVELSL